MSFSMRRVQLMGVFLREMRQHRIDILYVGPYVIDGWTSVGTTSRQTRLIVVRNTSIDLYHSNRGNTNEATDIYLHTQRSLGR